MKEVTRREFIIRGSALGTALAGTVFAGRCVFAADRQGFQAASESMLNDFGVKKVPGIQHIYALCEVTGGGEKVYGIAVQYDAAIDPACLTLDTFTTSVVPAAKGYFPGMPDGIDKDTTTAAPVPRAVMAIYTNDAPALRSDRKSVEGRYVIAEFEHNPDLSLPTTDSDKVSLTQG